MSQGHMSGGKQWHIEHLGKRGTEGAQSRHGENDGLVDGPLFGKLGAAIVPSACHFCSVCVSPMCKARAVLQLLRCGLLVLTSVSFCCSRGRPGERGWASMIMWADNALPKMGYVDSPPKGPYPEGLFPWEPEARTHGFEPASGAGQ